MIYPPQQFPSSRSPKCSDNCKSKSMHFSTRPGGSRAGRGRGVGARISIEVLQMAQFSAMTGDGLRFAMRRWPISGRARGVQSPESRMFAAIRASRETRKNDVEMPAHDTNVVGNWVALSSDSGRGLVGRISQRSFLRAVGFASERSIISISVHQAIPRFPFR
jgi:hypothetical protein